MVCYTIRYRCGDGRGSAYIVSSGALQVRLAGDDASARLARMLGRSTLCAPVAEAAPRPLDDLLGAIAPAMLSGAPAGDA